MRLQGARLQCEAAATKPQPDHKNTAMGRAQRAAACREGQERGSGRRGCYFRPVGWVKAPLPAESQTAKRTHFLPVASKGIAKWCVPKGSVDFRSMIWRSTLAPSLQTSSAKSSGNVYSISAV